MKSLPLVLAGGAVAILSAALFTASAPAEPEFPDEAAYLSQTYFWSLLRQPSSPYWLEYPALDLPPLPKYAMGFALECAGLPHPGRDRAIAWYGNTNLKFLSPDQLRVGRLPSFVLGALGCVAVFAIGVQVGGIRLGLIAAALLAVNPLYRLHATRAMSDVYAEAFTLCALACALPALKRALEERGHGLAGYLAWAPAGILAGLATLSKLSGALAILTLFAWGVLGLFVTKGRPRPAASLLAGVLIAALLALGTFVALNPFVTARPLVPLSAELARIQEQDALGRLSEVVRHRSSVSAGAKEQFPAYALRGPVETGLAIVVQGFGRFGALGPPRHDSLTEYPRYDWSRDWGAIVWLPLVFIGAWRGFQEGARAAREDKPPLGWALVLQGLVAIGVVAAFLPLAWDRYYLPLQGVGALLGAWGLLTVAKLVRPALPCPERHIAATFLIVLVSTSLFWHARDWNTSSRLMLMYAIADHGQISIDGLETQTGDRARFEGHWYSDKPPGLAMLGLPSYLVAKGLFRGPEHPRGVEALAYWPADWFVTIGTSGLATALASALLAHLAGRLGCSARASVLVGLAYGLATPALVYGELAYGHQVTACCLLGAWALVCAVPTSDVRHLWIRSCVVGFLLALSCVVEYQSAPLGAIVGLAFVLSHLRLPHVGSQLAAFAIGTLPPLFLLAVYNTLAFGSPLDFGYAHHAVPRFSHVHSAANPLGLQPPRWQLLPELLWRPYRGILAYAPVTLLAVPGWLALAQARRWSWLTVAFGVPALALGVNLCYPEWTGGWSTGPRFLLPALPFAMLAVAAAVARWPRFCFTLLAVTAAIGFVINILFQGVGGRIPESLGTTSPQATIRLLDQPLVREVWPMWRGEPLPGWATGGRFTRTALSELRFRVVQSLWGRSGPRESTRVELLAIALAQILAVVLVLRRLKPPRDHATTREAES